MDKPKLHSVHINNLPINCDEDKLVALFSQHGDVQDHQIQKDPPGSRFTYGFMRYKTWEEASESIVRLDGTIFEGKTLKVSEALGAKATRENNEVRPKREVWFCSECNFDNFSFRNVCMKCDEPRGTSTGTETSSSDDDETLRAYEYRDDHHLPESRDNFDERCVKSLHDVLREKQLDACMPLVMDELKMVPLQWFDHETSQPPHFRLDMDLIDGLVKVQLEAIGEKRLASGTCLASADQAQKTHPVIKSSPADEMMEGSGTNSLDRPPSVVQPVLSLDLLQTSDFSHTRTDKPKLGHLYPERVFTSTSAGNGSATAYESVSQVNSKTMYASAEMDVAVEKEDESKTIAQRFGNISVEDRELQNDGLRCKNARINVAHGHCIQVDFDAIGCDSVKVAEKLDDPCSLSSGFGAQSTSDSSDNQSSSDNCNSPVYMRSNIESVDTKYASNVKQGTGRIKGLGRGHMLFQKVNFK